MIDINGNSLDVLDQPAVLLENANQEIGATAYPSSLLLVDAAGAVAIECVRQLEEELTIEAPQPDTKESLAEQFASALEGYTSISAALNTERSNEDTISTISAEVLVSEFDDWLTEDRLAYVRAAQEADPELRFTLVATPNILANSQEIITAGKIFGQTTLDETYVWEELYCECSAQELSGTDPDNGNKVMFSLMPNKLEDRLYGTVAEQRAELIELQKVNPYLQVPSVLEAITNWYTLRAQNGGTLLNDDTNFDKSFVRNFDLPEKHIGNRLIVPHSCVYDHGEPFMDGARPGNVFGHVSLH